MDRDYAVLPEVTPWRVELQARGDIAIFAKLVHP
jgi:hypothetical protein